MMGLIGLLEALFVQNRKMHQLLVDLNIKNDEVCDGWVEIPTGWQEYFKGSKPDNNRHIHVIGSDGNMYENVWYGVLGVYWPVGTNTQDLEVMAWTYADSVNDMEESN